MNLPPLPEPDGFLCQRLYYKVGDVDEHCTQPHHNKWAEDQMREYGALCSKMALEEAAKKVDHITIGPYTIHPYPSGGYWIRHESGEGMQIFEANMLAWIEKLWKEEF